MKAQLVFLLFLTSTVLVAQNASDSLNFNGFLNFGVRLQSGNLNQNGVNGTLKLSLGNSTFATDVSANYNYVEVNDFNVINDSWNYATLKLKPQKRVYPIAMFYAGFAKSFGLKSAVLGGAGLGLNAFGSPDSDFLNLNLIGAYGQFDYLESNTINGAALNLNINAHSELLKDRLEIDWQLDAYSILNQQDAFGIQNNLRLSIPIYKIIRLSVSHQTVYNEVVDTGKEQLNTTFMGGIALRI